MIITFRANDEPVATLKTDLEIDFDSASAIAAILEDEAGAPVTIDISDA